MTVPDLTRDTDRNELRDIPRHVWLTAATIVLGSFMSFLDATAVSVGLNTIGEELDAALGTAQWIASGYLLALAAAIPATGWLVRRFGGRRVWLCALIAFSATSFLCALAQNIEQLIALRVAQGASGGMLLPAGQILVARAAGPTRMGRVIATTGVVTVLAPVLGPVLGGLLIEISWRWIFLVNVPVGAFAFAMGTRFLAPDHGGPSPPLDIPGLLLISAALPSAIYAITEAIRTATFTSPVILITAAIALAATTAFVGRELRVKAPLINLRILNNSRFGAAAVSAVFSAAALFGILVLTPLYLEIQRGFDPIETGLLMIGTGIGAVFFFPISGRLTDRYGGGTVATGGLMICCGSIAPMAALPADASLVLVEILFALNGIGFTMGLLPVVASAYAAVKQEQLPDATPIMMGATRVGGSIGTALFVVLLEHRINAGRPPVEAFHASFIAALVATAAAIPPAIVLARRERRSLATDARSRPPEHDVPVSGSGV